MLTFTKKTFLISTVCFLVFNCGYAQSGKKLYPEHPGVVSYTYRNYFSKDVPGTIDLISQNGFTDIEFSNLFGKTASQLRALIDAKGIKCSSFGVSYDDFVNKIDTVAQNAKILGAQYVRISSLPHKGDFSLDDAQKAVELFNRMGKLLKDKYGLTFIYHNHGFEFQPYKDGTLYDYIVQNTNPEYVSFELDILWAFFPGQDPAKLLDKYGSRYKCIHLKNIKKGIPGNLSGGTDSNYETSLGEGAIDVDAVMRAAKRANIQHYYIEDESNNVLVNVPRSIAYLNSLQE
jgi:sugar phosphate isomerase/epimerase